MKDVSVIATASILPETIVSNREVGQKLIDGIRNKLYTLPDETRIYPGHGEPTTVGLEKRTNPFTREGVSLF